MLEKLWRFVRRATASYEDVQAWTEELRRLRMALQVIGCTRPRRRKAIERKARELEWLLHYR